MDLEDLRDPTCGDDFNADLGGSRRLGTSLLGHTVHLALRRDGHHRHTVLSVHEEQHAHVTLLFFSVLFHLAIQLHPMKTDDKKLWNLQIREQGTPGPVSSRGATEEHQLLFVNMQQSIIEQWIVDIFLCER